MTCGHEWLSEEFLSRLLRGRRRREGRVVVTPVGYNKANNIGGEVVEQGEGQRDREGQRGAR